MKSSLDGSSPLSPDKRLQAMLAVEAALASSLQKSGIISREQAAAISEACESKSFNAIPLNQAGAIAGTPVIPLVKEIVSRTKAKSGGAASYIHYGATSQDILDTATVLQLKEAVSQIGRQLQRIESAFSSLAKEHVNTVVLGRTLLQPGPPVSFGLKVAAWKAAITRGRQRLEAAANGGLVVQFGGAVGNLSSLDDKGMQIAQFLAAELDLELPDAPWHTHRDRMAELASATGILIGSMGKIARDISLHGQGEVGELHEAAPTDEGSSSAMPHKRNPVSCMHVLVASNQAPALVSSLLSAMPQEHERGLGGWQSEWPTLQTLFAAAMSASAAMAELSERLEVDTAKMKSNLQSTREVVFSERLATSLIPQLGRLEAQELVSDLVAKSNAHGKRLSELAAEDATIQSTLNAAGLEAVFSIELSLGSSEELTNRLLQT